MLPPLEPLKLPLEPPFPLPISPPKLPELLLPGLVLDVEPTEVMTDEIVQEASCVLSPYM